MEVEEIIIKKFEGEDFFTLLLYLKNSLKPKVFELKGIFKNKIVGD